MRCAAPRPAPNAVVGSVGDGLGGAIFNLDGTLSLAGSTITHDLALGRGAAQPLRSEARSSTTA
jgi:hypothetical protein